MRNSSRDSLRTSCRPVKSGTAGCLSHPSTVSACSYGHPRRRAVPVIPSMSVTRKASSQPCKRGLGNKLADKERRPLDIADAAGRRRAVCFFRQRVAPSLPGFLPISTAYARVENCGGSSDLAPIASTSNATDSTRPCLTAVSLPPSDIQTESSRWRRPFGCSRCSSSDCSASSAPADPWPARLAVRGAVSR